MKTLSLLVFLINVILHFFSCTSYYKKVDEILIFVQYMSLEFFVLDYQKASFFKTQQFQQRVLCSYYIQVPCSMLCALCSFNLQFQSTFGDFPPRTQSVHLERCLRPLSHPLQGILIYSWISTWRSLLRDTQDLFQHFRFRKWCKETRFQTSWAKVTTGNTPRSEVTEPTGVGIFGVDRWSQWRLREATTALPTQQGIGHLGGGDLSVPSAVRKALTSDPLLAQGLAFHHFISTPACPV